MQASPAEGYGLRPNRPSGTSVRQHVCFRGCGRLAMHQPSVSLHGFIFFLFPLSTPLRAMRYTMRREEINAARYERRRKRAVSTRFDPSLETLRSSRFSVVNARVSERRRRPRAASTETRRACGEGGEARGSTQAVKEKGNPTRFKTLRRFNRLAAYADAYLYLYSYFKRFLSNNKSTKCIPYFISLGMCEYSVFKPLTLYLS